MVHHEHHRNRTRGTAIEGPETKGVWHLVELPDARAVHEFWASPEYAGLRPLRDGAADVRAVLIEPATG